MSIKYKIDDTKKNKNLINDEIKLSRIKSKGGNGDDRTPPKKQKSTRDLLIEFMGEQRAFNTRMEKQVSNLRSDVNTLKINLNRVIKLNNLKQ